MINRLKHRMQEDEGFTLIELLIVIVVLGILAAIVVFALSNQTSNSLQAACRADAKAVEIAQEAYRASGPGPNTFAPNLAALTVPDANGQVYLRSVPGTNHYQIVTDGSGKVWVYAKAPAPAPVPGDDTPVTGNNFDTNTNACAVAS